jgi:signal transduction histidine kinase
MKTRTRIALLFFSLTITVMLVLGFAVYYFSAQYAFTDFYKRLKTRAQLAGRIHFEGQDGPNLPYVDLRQNILETLPNEEDFFFEIPYSQHYEPLVDSLGLPLNFFEKIVQEGYAEHRKGDIFSSGIKYMAGDKSFFVIVSAEHYFYSHHIANLGNIILIALVLTAILLLSVSLVFSRHVFRPIEQITRRVRDINSQNLHLRLEGAGPNDEVKELKQTFNTMLDRLEAAFATQNNFISNASHELSTPLTAIMGEAEVALSKQRDAAEYQSTLHTISSHAERLERITRSLLFLAQTGFDGVKQNFGPVRIDQLLWNVKETIEQMDPRNQLRINMTLMPDNPYKLKIEGNEQLLHLALTNIISNGCKYSDHKPVDVSLGISDAHVILVIADNGIGIPKSEMQFIYDPFFRASNTSDYEGFGIGLPLTRNIVRIHHGSIRVDSKLNQGTIVELTFPIAKRFLIEF